MSVCMYHKQLVVKRGNKPLIAEAKSGMEIKIGNLNLFIIIFY